MLRMVVTICAVSQLVLALPAPAPEPQRPVQQSGGLRPNPQPQATSTAQASTLGQFSPSYNQQLSFGGAQPAAAAAPQRRGPATYQSPQPIIISQAGQSASPATPGSAFASFPGAAFGGAGRQILTLRSPQSSQDDDEYEYEDDDEPTIQSRPSPTPQRTVPVTRAPVRVVQPQQQLGQLGGAGRFSAQQQPQRSRQPVPQNILSAQQPLQAQRIQPQSAPRPSGANPGFGIDGKRSRLTTPPPIQTVNRYMKNNEDGSITWGYENEDGTFKEETLGADCVVRGKYGYIDPEGNKREYEYQTGNPCDPNKKDQEEEVEEDDDLPDGPSRGQQIAGLVNARPRPVQRRPVGGGIPQYQPQPQYQ